MNGEAIVKVGTAVIALIGTIITYMIVPYIKSKTTAEQQENIKFWVKIAVNAAEQIFQEKGQGQQKKQYVINFLSNKGIKITMEQLDILIEAAVHELTNTEDRYITPYIDVNSIDADKLNKELEDTLKKIDFTAGA